MSSRFQAVARGCENKISHQQKENAGDGENGNQLGQLMRDAVLIVEHINQKQIDAITDDVRKDVARQSFGNSAAIRKRISGMTKVTRQCAYRIENGDGNFWVHPQPGHTEINQVPGKIA